MNSDNQCPTKEEHNPLERENLPLPIRKAFHPGSIAEITWGESCGTGGLVRAGPSFADSPHNESLQRIK